LAAVFLAGKGAAFLSGLVDFARAGAAAFAAAFAASLAAVLAGADFTAALVLAVVLVATWMDFFGF
jgi:hypothetical protein